MYFKAIVKEPSILKTVQKTASQRTGSFIGMLDGVIGDVDFKKMRDKHHESRVK